MFRREDFRRDLETLVNMDSGSYQAEGVKRVNEWLAFRLEKAGWSIKRYEPSEGPSSGAFLAYDKSYDNLGLLLLCHTDTVFGEGEAAKRPFSVSPDGSRYFGPGVSDMKGGCVFVLHAAEDFIKTCRSGRLALFFNGQEEVGSVGTRHIMEELSKNSGVVIAAEAARPNGDCLKQRRGISRYTLKFRGRTAHSGVNPQDGQCAVTEMANWILFLKGLTDPEKGINVNCGVVKGGTVANIVPDYAELKIDVRVTDYEDARRIEKIIFGKAEARFNENVAVEIEGRITRPPMMPTEETEKICSKITELGKKRGFKVTWGSSGGGSDASFASGLGVVALDGMGPRGGGFHTENEYLDLSDIDERYRLLRDTIDMLAK